MNPYSIHVHAIDVSVALRCEADRARSEQMTRTAERQDALALHIENAQHALSKICPPGHSIHCQIVFTAVPMVNPVLKPEYL